MKNVQKINLSRLRVGEQISFYETVNSYVNLLECKEAYQLNSVLSDSLNDVSALRKSYCLNNSRSQVKQAFKMLIDSWRQSYVLTSALIVSGETPELRSEAALLKTYLDAHTKPFNIAQEQAAGIINDQLKYISQSGVLATSARFVNQLALLTTCYNDYNSSVDKLLTYKMENPGGAIAKSMLTVVEAYRELINFVESYCFINNSENYSNLIDKINLYITKISYRLTVSQAADDNNNNVEPKSSVA